MRTYADPVEVRTGTGEDTDTPAAFLWRGRLYVVRDVLGHWRERRSWWSSRAARLVHGEGGEGGEDHEPAGAGGRGGDLPGGGGGGGGARAGGRGPSPGGRSTPRRPPRPPARGRSPPP